MARNPFQREMAAEERLLSRDAARRLTEALRARRLQQQVDAATTQSGRTPQREVLRLYERALQTEVRRLTRQLAGLTLETQVTYVLQRGKWQATVDAAVRYRLTTSGGASHVLSPGETLWSIAERYYGSGAYWIAIPPANRRIIDPRRPVLRCGVQITVPQILCATDAQSLPRSLVARPPSAAQVRVRPNNGAYPSVQCSVNALPSWEREQCVGPLRVHLKLEPKGTIKVTQVGTAPATLDCQSYKAEMTRRINAVTAAFEVSDFTTAKLQLSNRVLGGAYTTAISLDTNGSIGYSIQPRPLTRRVGNTEIEAAIGFEVTIRATGTCAGPQGPRVPVLEVATATVAAGAAAAHASEIQQAGTWVANCLRGFGNGLVTFGRVATNVVNLVFIDPAYFQDPGPA